MVGIRFAVFLSKNQQTFFLLIFADFAEFQQTAKLLMKTLVI
jgi:hypothetical protein